ncbi:MAG: hydantoinase B/oxoprolinase family protein [Desulfovibrio sp.]|nr:MAG: hydantoinase B/oxoprolinase family protein [Desulfovibrio sp.]
MPAKEPISPILLEVFKNRFASIAEEMGVSLMRTGFSPNIKERRDFSCALFDTRANMIAQAAHIPVHLGSMPLSVQRAVEAVELGPGDMAVLNNPFAGGTHLPDITLVAPVFAPDDAGGHGPLFFVANRAHHADVGGMSPGSMPLASSLYQEGLIIPPLKLVRGGEIDAGIMGLILANVRTPEEREGDFAAQVMANVTGVRRMGRLLAKHGPDLVRDCAQALLDYGEAAARRAVADIPDGEYEYEDHLDDDGLGTQRIPLHLRLRIQGDNAEFDFSRSGPQARGGVNAVRAIAVSAVLYGLRCLMDDSVPTNSGLLRPITLTTRPGSIVDAQFPASVAAGNVETSQRMVDVVLGALAQALRRTRPELASAASQGTMNNVTVGGTDSRNNSPEDAGAPLGKPFAYYETLAGGMGATGVSSGESAVHSHMTNTLNTPVEALEYAYPFMVTEYSVRRDSGGKGAFSGGNGLVREIQFLSNAEVTVLSERRKTPPPGLAGGEPGKPGKNLLCQGGQWRTLPGKFHESVLPGDVLRIETPGGGGFGPADQDMVPKDSTDE